MISKDFKIYLSKVSNKLVIKIFKLTKTWLKKLGNESNCPSQDAKDKVTNNKNKLIKRLWKILIRIYRKKYCEPVMTKTKCVYFALIN